MCVSVCAVLFHVYFTPLYIYRRNHRLPRACRSVAEKHDGPFHLLRLEIEPGTRKTRDAIDCKRRYCQKINIIKSVIVSVSSESLSRVYEYGF